MREIDYTTFWHLQKAAVADDAAFVHLPSADGKAAFTALDRLREFRNHVANYGNAVHTLDAEYLRSGRNDHDFAELYDELKVTVSRLRDWQQRSDRPAFD